MIIDTDTHITDRSGGVNMSIEKLIGLLDKLGVDKAVCWPMVSYYNEVAEDNATIAKGMKKYPDRIIGFSGLNPLRGKDETKAELKRCAEEYGVCGVKFNGARDGYFIDDEKLALPFVEEVAKRGLIIAFHCGANDSARTHPWQVGQIAKRFPETTMLMVHMGGAGFGPALYDAGLRAAKECPNIYMVASECAGEAIENAIRTLGANRVMYASDAPFVAMKYGWVQIQAVLEDFSEEEKKLVMGETAAEIFKT